MDPIESRGVKGEALDDLKMRIRSVNEGQDVTHYATPKNLARVLFEDLSAAFTKCRQRVWTQQLSQLGLWTALSESCDLTEAAWVIVR